VKANLFIFEESPTLKIIMKIMKFTISLIISLLPLALTAQNNTQYWKVTNRNSIVWYPGEKKGLPHSDNIEMGGRKVAAIIYYTIDRNGNLKLERDIIYPQLRTFIKSDEPDFRNYRAYYRHTYRDEIQPKISLGNKNLMHDKVDSVEIAGKLIFYHTPVNGIRIVRTLMPSMTERLFVEKWQIENLGDSLREMEIGSTGFRNSEKGYKGEYTLHAYSNADKHISLLPGKKYSFAIFFSAGMNEEETESFDLQYTENQRDEFLNEMKENLILETPDVVLNTLFYFSKIRAAENIFDSKMGIVHSPGGGNYYAGVWANDQVEYSGPFFPFLGYEAGNTAAYNAYRMFLHNIPDNWQPIFSSFEMEGDLPCCGRDRGDAAMIAFGASQFCLMNGDEAKAKELWPLIEWALEYCNRQLDEHGVVKSTTDEMEGRISTGDANLATNSLYYGGLKFASYLSKQLGFKDKADLYSKRQKEIAQAIEKHFGYNLEGLDTYRYFDGNTHLRHWICLPLVMGIQTRSEGTITALLDKLWTPDGVLVEYNPESKQNNTFWDRGTLYALRGTFKSGAVDRSLEKLTAFSNKRLLGDHVPYVIEAYPENNMRHLSAESALYCRIFTEGMLGFEQTGFNSFQVTPRLPSDFEYLTIDKMHMSGSELSIRLKREKDNIRISVKKDDKMIADKLVPSGKTINIKF
jgi:hypothetical protein